MIVSAVWASHVPPSVCSDRIKDGMVVLVCFLFALWDFFQNVNTHTRTHARTHTWVISGDGGFLSQHLCIHGLGFSHSPRAFRIAVAAQPTHFWGLRRAPATLRQPSAPQAIAAKLLGLHTVTNSESSFPYLHSLLLLQLSVPLPTPSHPAHWHSLASHVRPGRGQAVSHVRAFASSGRLCPSKNRRLTSRASHIMRHTCAPRRS